MKYTREWTDLTHKMGYWVDLDNPYITYDNRYIESVWWLLKELYNKGYLYKGYTIQPYSPGAGTGLSSHELNQPGCYRDVKDLTATALLRSRIPNPKWRDGGVRVFLRGQQLRGHFLPTRLYVSVFKFEYVTIRTYNPYTAEKITVVMASDLVGSYFKKEGETLSLEEYKQGDKVLPYRIVGRFSGEDLIGMHYQQLMPWVKPVEKLNEYSATYVTEFAEANPGNVFTVGNDRFVEMAECAFRVIGGDYVTTDDGTGIVHIAPTFGADDVKVAKAANIPLCS